MILVDTSVWIDFFRGADTSGRKALHKLIEDEEDICTTEIILTEILQGIKRDVDFKKVKGYLLGFPIYCPDGLDTYLRAAGIYRHCRKRGKTIRKTIDCIIAAIAIENSLTLFHNDRDFEQIAECSELKVLKDV
ncbi:MAG: PIN domain nuclease [Deltaproteobacteria bacterium]|nr:PIN domain nuclease [Deltaproteobacteria bacterium]